MIIGIGVVQVPNGILGTFLAVRLTLFQYSATAVGLVATAYALGFLVGCLLASRAIRVFGHIRAFVAFAAALAAHSLAFAIIVHPVPWIILRLLTGFCTAGMFTVAESWLNDQTPVRARGRVISLSMIGQKLSFGAGQLLLAVGDTVGPFFFMVCSAAYSLALLPVALTRSRSPAIHNLGHLPLIEAYRIAPAAAVGCFAAGLTNTAVIMIFPAFATRIGLDMGPIAVLMALLQIGSLLLQWPMGWLADRIDRLVVVAASGIVLTVISVVIGLTEADSLWILYGLFTLWGGFALAIYPICIAHANDYVDRRQMVMLASRLLLAWGAGSTLGPTLATIVMDVVGPGGLFFYAAVVAAMMTAFVAFDITRRHPAPESAGHAPAEPTPAEHPPAANRPAQEASADQTRAGRTPAASQPARSPIARQHDRNAEADDAKPRGAKPEAP